MINPSDSSEDLRRHTKEAQVLVARLRRQGTPVLLAPQALNDLGFRTETGEPFDFASLKRLITGEIGAKR